MTILRGRVVDPQGHPVADAAVYIVAAPGPVPDVALLTDEFGQFALSAPVAGRYVIAARSDRWEPAQTEVVVGAEESIAIKIKMMASA